VSDVSMEHEKPVAELALRKVEGPDPALIEPWDVNAASRADELVDDGDPAYQALSSLILGILREHVPIGSLVMDAGCGLGYLSNSMAQVGYKVVGIDPSRASLDRAIKKFDLPSFFPQSIEEVAADGAVAPAKYEAIVANMVLHATPYLGGFLSSAERLLRPGGSFIAALPHPCFFLQTKEGRPLDADYSSDAEFWIDFRINGRRPHSMRVPYFHRPIAEYSEGLYAAGFRDVHIEEPEHIGPGRPNDIIAIYATKEQQPAK
jgi:SAM-dependent methyltransferase